MFYLKTNIIIVINNIGDSMNINSIASSLFMTVIAVQLNEVFLTEESSLKTFTNRILFIIVFCEVLKAIIMLIEVLVGYFGTIT